MSTESAAFDNLRLEHDDGIAVLTIDRPPVLNALNAQTIDELRRAALILRHDSATRAVIVTGAGDRAFVSGADINELAVQTPSQGQTTALRGQHVLSLLEHLGKPVIAAVNGYALGGGCELAMACTVRIAAETAKFGQPEVKLGIIPGYGGTQRLPRLVGRGRALELLLTGSIIDAAEAYRIGLVNKVVPRDRLLDEAKAMARAMIANAPLALQYTIEAVERGLETSLDDGSFLEATLFGLVASSEDMKEGTRAFLEKRKPVFKGK